ncbi:MAG: diguanylate cyclase, partial [Planctomycetota bacterium]
AKSRLGIHVSLFQALRAKHPPTASHSLRVALTCSKWACWRQLDAQQWDWLEVAALLHDIGKIAVPEEVLHTPLELNQDQKIAMDAQRSLADQLLESAGAESGMVQIVQAARLSFAESEQEGICNPLGSMLAIADAFDSMTTEQVFRKALSHEVALQELCRNAGTQFDAELVQDFANMNSQPRLEVEQQIAGRWLSKLSAPMAPGFSEHLESRLEDATSHDAGLERVFHLRMLEATKEGVIYLDRQGQILSYNRAAEELTGRRGSALMHRCWRARSIGLRHLDGSDLESEECPLKAMRATNTPFSAEFLLQNQSGQDLPVQLRAIPVFSEDRENCGSILLLEDESQQVKLERQVASLHKVATSDPLTKVANRAELNSRLPTFLESHLQSGHPGSMIICDIDFFKRINDNFGHQAGDEALVTFASLLADSAREYDLVARYGGEEFVILCEGCDNATATNRAEEMRKRVESTPVPSLNNRNMTSSFGVTELQRGDTIESFMARADRALLMAKENGRNRVMQLGAGQDIDVAVETEFPEEQPNEARRNGWLSWFANSRQPLFERDFLASLPRDLAVQKLDGFIHDHGGQVESVEDNLVVIRLKCNSKEVRKGDRITNMLMRIEIKEVQFDSGARGRTSYQNRTLFAVSVLPHRARDRREGSLRNQAVQLMISFQAYLAAEAIDGDLRSKIIMPR